MENKISQDKNVLVALPQENKASNELQYLIENFCGIVVKSLSEVPQLSDDQIIYACGDLAEFNNDGALVYIIKELSQNYENLTQENIHFIALGQVPVVIHNAGVYFRHFFQEEDYFHKIKAEHEFQHLTESSKPSKALRKGIYITEVVKEEIEGNTGENQEMLHYRLLRCSSNLSGPTDNFRNTDHKIIKALNQAASQVFEHKTSLNHVLAQIYENRKTTGEKVKETKAKIKAHSDKTKDMLEDGLIAFCTFYDQSNFQHLELSKTGQYDWCYKNKTGLTSLHFKLKNSVQDDSLVKEFTVTLYPNSVFIIPLSTNRLYTHAIKPSILNIDRIPTRMGYVVRSSKAEAVFMNDETYLKENGELVKLEQMTQETVADLRNSYYKENTTENQIAYGKVHFSMNLGDYQKPIY